MLSVLQQPDRLAGGKQSSSANACQVTLPSCQEPVHVPCFDIPNMLQKSGKVHFAHADMKHLLAAVTPCTLAPWQL